MSKFTKGKWRVEETDLPISESAVYNIMKDEFYVGEGYTLEDAELMAVAPDMYKFIEDLQLDVADDIIRDELLARARGELS